MDTVAPHENTATSVASAVLNESSIGTKDSEQPVAVTAELPYLSAADLEEKPYPREPVIVPYPEALLGKAKGAVVLLLYVDSSGTIDRIDVDRSDVPIEFERSAIEAFQSVQMSPGLAGGIATRAKIKILVEFESQ